MTELLFGHDKIVAEWVGQKIGKPFSEPFTAIGTLGEGGRLTGGAVFTNYTGDAVEISIAGRGVVCRSFWSSVAHYVFEQLKCSRLAIHTSEKNKRVRRMAPKFGFVYEGTARKMYGKFNGLAYSLIVSDLSKFKDRWKI